jgi:23S rRNA (adenine2030-N6)-methyltransferase
MPGRPPRRADAPFCTPFDVVPASIAHPMNYRHAFHAGNFADVMKHIVLVRVIEYLKQKPKPFRFIDTHAGIGLYDISGDEARRSGEWRDGIGKLLCDEGFAARDVEPGSEIAGLIQPYLDVLSAVNGGQNGAGQPLRYYPGGGEIARRLLRADDRLVLNELHPEDARAQRRHMAGDERVKTLQLDGWTMIKSVLPPKERRGVVLVDPAFEVAGEFQRLEMVLSDATERFATGVTLLWYPIKAASGAEAFVKRMANSGHKRLLQTELLVRHRDTLQGLNGCGLLIHNPPYGLDDQLKLIMPYLAKRLTQQAGAGAHVTWLAGE